MRFPWRVERMCLSRDKTQIAVNPSLTLGVVPVASLPEGACQGRGTGG